MKNILLLGSGGREHVFAMKLASSQLTNKLFIAPGNAGTSSCGENVNLNINDFEAIAKFYLDNEVNWLIPGSEDPLVNGIWDYFNNSEELKDIEVLGPSGEGAKLEGSKDYAKEFMAKNNIPTAKYKTFTKDTISEAKRFLKDLEAPYVLKADGLAAGKGVVISESYDAACTELDEMLLNEKFGSASRKVVIEEFLEGIELSVFALTDGEHYVILPEAKDYKRIGEGDTGLNTGGMGSISPVSFADKAFMDRVDNEIVGPTIQGLKNANIPYKGFVFIGLMNLGGVPKVIEYNVRMGDPETQSVFARMDNDFGEMFEAVANESIESYKLKVNPKQCCTVILVSGGYPESYQKGKAITGLENLEDSILVHAGTKMQDNALVTNGGRVLAITSFGDTLQDALSKSLINANKVDFEGKYYRTDIGQDLLKLSQ